MLWYYIGTELKSTQIEILEALFKSILIKVLPNKLYTKQVMSTCRIRFLELSSINTGNISPPLLKG